MMLVEQRNFYELKKELGLAGKPRKPVERQQTYPRPRNSCTLRKKRL